MIRFKRSEYNSVLKDDSTYSGRTEESPTPLFLDTETEALIMWSGEGDIPEVGDKVDMRVPVRYQGVVKSHFFAYGYVGVKVLPYPQHHEELRKQGYGQLPKVGEKWTVKDLVYNYGCDIYTEEVRKTAKV